MRWLANLRKGDNFLVSNVEAFGSRAGSMYKGRGPLPTSDLDIMIKVNSKYLDDDWVLRTIQNIQDDFFKETGIP